MIEGLKEFFKDRTIGYGDIFDGWYWRGPGYDEGWAPLTADEIHHLYLLLREQ